MGLFSGAPPMQAQGVGMSLEQAQALLHAGLSEGTTCLCCNRYIKVYPRQYSYRMALGLIWLVQHAETQPPGSWTHLWEQAPRYVLRGYNIALNRHWNLIERKPREEGGNWQGHWRPTAQGYEVAHRRSKLSAEVYLLVDKVVWRSPREILIDEAMTKFFDYEEVMRPAYNWSALENIKGRPTKR